MSVIIDKRLGRSEVPTFSPEMITPLERAPIPDSFNADDLTAIRPLARSVDDMWKDPHYAQLYTDQDWFQRYTQQDSFQELRDLPDFPEMAQGMLNRAFLSDLWGDSLDNIDDTYDARRDVFAQELLGRPAKSEADLAQGIADGFANTATEIGARIARGTVVGVQQTRAGFYSVLESLLRGQRNPYIDKTTAEAQADVATLQARVAELEAEQDERRRGEFNTFSGIPSPELSQLRRQLEMAQLAAKGQVSENFLGSLSRASDDLADDRREDQARAGTLFSDVIVPAHNDWWMMRVADSLGQSAAGTATTMLNPVLGLSLIYAQTYEGSLAEYQAVAQERGLDTSIEAAERYAHGQALIQTPFELVGDVKIGKAIKGAFGSIPRKVLTSGPEPYGHWIAERTKEITKSLAGEVLITTPAQTIGESLLAENAGVRNETSWQNKGWATLDAMSIAIGQAGAMTGGSLAISGGIKVAKGDFSQAKAKDKPKAFQPEGTHKGFIDLEARPAEVSDARFSKGAVTPSDIGGALLSLNENPETARLGPTPTSKDIAIILETLSPEAAKDVEIVPHSESDDAGFTFETPRGVIFLLKDHDDTYHVNSAGAKSKATDSDQAIKNYNTDIYQTIYSWAHNNNKIIQEDTIMLDDGIYRRTSQMLSNAIRHQTTKHMTVGEWSQIHGWKNGHSSEEVAHNVGLLALKERDIVRQRLPILDEMRYDLETNAFYDKGHRIPDEKVEAYIGARIDEVGPKVSSRVGPATLRRALVVNELERSGAEAKSGTLGGLSRDNNSLSGIRYAKDTGRSRAVKADDVEGRARSEASRPQPLGPEIALQQRNSRAEPAPVSGGTGPEGSSQSLVSNPPTVSRVEQILDGIQSRWGSRLKTKVHESVDTISDQRLREGAQREGSVEAFFDPSDGTIHIIADRVNGEADVERLLRHEGIHWAFNGPLRREYLGLLDEIRELIPAERWQELSHRYKGHSDAAIVEEYLAYEGQNNPRSSAWQSFAYEVKRLLRQIFGDKIRFTDSNVLALLSKANRKLERNSSPGVTQTSSDQGVSYSKKGQGRENWDDVQSGDDFNAVKKLLPRSVDAPLILDTRKEPEEIFQAIADELTLRPTTSDPDGLSVLIDNPEKDTKSDPLSRARHLAASKEDLYKRGERVFNAEKAKWTLNIWKTIEDYGVKIKHYNDIAYARKYRDGTIHIVFVENGKVTNQVHYDVAVVSQRSLDSTHGIKGATVYKKREAN